MDLANKLGIGLSTIRPRFLRLFGEEYTKVAKHKLDGSLLNYKGQLAEYLGLEYLRLKGIDVNDVRGKAILKGTLKRPDFVVDDTFIEIKSYYINLNKRKVKGYLNIIDDYLRKETKDGKILTRGIIISLGGFSEEVKKKAHEDGLLLIGYKDLKVTFEENNQIKFLELLSELVGF